NAVSSDNGCAVGGNHSTTSTLQRGNSWFWGYYAQSITFTTLMAPNSRLWDCNSQTPGGMHAARSLHSGGVQVAVGDGSVRFVSESIDFLTWRHLGGT